MNDYRCGEKKCTGALLYEERRADRTVLGLLFCAWLMSVCRCQLRRDNASRGMCCTAKSLSIWESTDRESMKLQCLSSTNMYVLTVINLFTCSFLENSRYNWPTSLDHQIISLWWSNNNPIIVLVFIKQIFNKTLLIPIGFNFIMIHICWIIRKCMSKFSRPYLGIPIIPRCLFLLQWIKIEPIHSVGAGHTSLIKR